MEDPVLAVMAAIQESNKPVKELGKNLQSGNLIPSVGSMEDSDIDTAVFLLGLIRPVKVESFFGLVYSTLFHILDKWVVYRTLSKYNCCTFWAADFSLLNSLFILLLQFVKVLVTRAVWRFSSIKFLSVFISLG